MSHSPQECERREGRIAHAFVDLNEISPLRSPVFAGFHYRNADVSRTCFVCSLDMRLYPTNFLRACLFHDVRHFQRSLTLTCSVAPPSFKYFLRGDGISEKTWVYTLRPNRDAVKYVFTVVQQAGTLEVDGRLYPAKKQTLSLFSTMILPQLSHHL